MRIPRASTARGTALAALALLAGAAFHCTSFGSDDGPGGVDAGSGEGASPPPALSPSCEGDRCDCDGVVANGRETAVLGGDRDNCGACGRACGVSNTLGDRTCTQGVCTAVPVASDQKKATALVARGDDVAWGTEDGNVVIASAAANWAPTPVLPKQDRPIDSLAMDDEFVYVVANYLPNNDGRLVRLQRNGSCGAACLKYETAQSEGAVSRVLLADATLFFVYGRSGNVLDDLRSARPTGFADGGSTLHSASFLGAIAVGGGFVHSAEYSSGTIGMNRLMVRPVEPCPQATPQCTMPLVPDANVAGMDADNDAVFFADAQTHVLGRKARSAAAPIEPIVSNLVTAGLVALDGADVYFTDGEPAADGGPPETGRVLRIGKNGKCGAYAPCPQILASGVAGLSSIAIGKTMVFFTSSTANQVFRTPK